MAALKLDLDKPHGKVFPPLNRAHFEQGGFYFTAQGDLIEDDEHLYGEDQKAKLEKAKVMAQADQAAKEAYAKVMADAGQSLRAKGIEIEGDDDDEGGKSSSDDEVDPVMWAKRLEKAPVAMVLESAKKLYGVNFTSSGMLVSWMIDNGHIREGDVKVKVKLT